MNRILFILLFVLSFIDKTMAQGADCSAARSMTVGYLEAGLSISDATIETPTNTCGLTALMDGWFKFTATAANITVSVSTTTAGNNPFFVVYSGTCGALTSIVCRNGDNTTNAQTELATLTGLIACNTYYVRVMNSVAANMVVSMHISATTSCTGASTAAINFTENFETGASACCPNWVLVNGTQRTNWYWGTTTNNGGSKAMYISNDGGSTNTYNSNESTVHFYKDITFPASGCFVLSFDWRAVGESPNYDYLEVFLVSTSTIPTAGSLLSIGSLGRFLSSSATTYSNATINIPATVAGTTQRLVFTWQNDGSVENLPPAAVDNISITSNPLTAPLCANYTAPANTSPNICPSGTTLSWNPGTSGSCNTPTSYDVYFNSGTVASTLVSASQTGTTYNTGSLTIGTTYAWRIVPKNSAGNASGCATYTFTVSSVTTPTNDDPCSAIALTVGSFCDYNTYSNACATATTVGSPPPPGCSNYAGGDIWFSVVVPTTGSLVFDTQAESMTDGAMAIYSGSCGALTLISCDDNSGNGNMPQIILSNQTPGVTLWVRIWESSNDNNGTFKLCVYNPCPFGAPANDLCTGATTITLGVVQSGSNFCTTSTDDPVTPACWSAGTLNTVWFKVVCPPSGGLKIRTGAITLTNTQIELFSGSCGALTSVACNENANNCGGTPLQISEIIATGLTAGATYFIRVDGSSNTLGTFNIVVVSDASDYPDVFGQDCGSAIPVCNSTMNIGNPGFQSIGFKCDFPSGVNCTSGDRGGVWYQIPITAAGNLMFTIVPNDYFGAFTETDYDFALYKLGGSGAFTCAQIANGTATSSACNFNLRGVTGLFTGGNAPSPYSTYYNSAFEEPVVVAPGDLYYLWISNFSNSLSGFSISYANSTCTIGYTTTSVVWSGNLNNEATNITNWGGCGLPSCTVDANILSASANSPVISSNMSFRNLTIDAGASITIDPGITVTICGNFTNNGILNLPNTSTIQFTDPSATHNISGNFTGISRFGNILVNKTGGSVLLNTDIDVGGNLTTQNNTSIFNSNGKIIKLAGNFNNFNGATTYTNATSGTLEFNGAAAQTYNEGSSQLTLGNININNSSGNVTLNSPMFGSGTLTMTSGLLNTTGTNILTLLASSNSSTGSSTSTSFVNGPMRIQKNVSGLATLNFPIGKSPDSRPLSLTVNHNVATAYNYTAEVFNSSAVALGYTLPTATVDTVSNVHFWDITRTLASTGVVSPSAGLTGNQTVQLYFGLNDGVYNGSQLTVVKNTASAPTTWIDIGGTGGPGTSSTPLAGSITSTSSPSAFNSFSRFTLGSRLVGLNPLPVELINFHGEKSTVGNWLFWQTATEHNSDRFVIQRSENGTHFSDIGTVKAAGNSNKLNSYQYIDEQAFSNILYYRIKQYDFNGKIAYSDIIAIINDRTPFTVSNLMPNPTAEDVSYEIINSGKGNLVTQVYDANGSLVLNQIVNIESGKHKINIESSKLAHGAYMIKIIFNEQNIKIYKLIKL